MSTTPTRRGKTRRRSSSTGSKPSQDVNLADLLNSAAKGISRDPPPKKTGRKQNSNGGFDNGSENHKNHPTKDTWVSPCEDQEQNLRYFLYIYKCDACDLRRNCPNKVTCPGWHHEGERRRNPGQFVYSEDPCPHTKGSGSNKWLSPSRCPAGDGCPYSHTLLEQMYHPCIYKTSLCINFTHVSGNRCQWGYYCTHAHGRDDIRTPPRRMHPSGSASSVGSLGMYSHAYPNAMYNRTRAVSDSAMPHMASSVVQPHMHPHGGGLYHAQHYARFEVQQSPPQQQPSWASRVKTASEPRGVPTSKAPPPPPGLQSMVPRQAAAASNGGSVLIPQSLPRDKNKHVHSSNKSDSSDSNSPRSKRASNNSPRGTPRRKQSRRRSYSDPKQHVVPVLNGKPKRSLPQQGAKLEDDGTPLNWRQPFHTSEELSSNHSVHSSNSHDSSHKNGQIPRSSSSGSVKIARMPELPQQPQPQPQPQPISHQSPPPSQFVRSRERSTSSPSIRLPPTLNINGSPGSTGKLFAGAPPYFPQTAAGSTNEISPSSSVSGAGMPTTTNAPSYHAPSPPQQHLKQGPLSTGTASALASKIFHKGSNTFKSLISSLNKNREETDSLNGMKYEGGDRPNLPRTVTPDILTPPPTAHAIDNPDPTLYIHPEDEVVQSQRSPMHPTMLASHAPRQAVAGWHGDRYGHDAMDIDLARLYGHPQTAPRYTSQRYSGSYMSGAGRDSRPSSEEFDHLIYELEKERRTVQKLQKENSRLNALVSGDTVQQLQKLIVCPNCKSSESERNHVVIPCGHLICENCDKRVHDVCPLCNSHVTGHIPIQV